MLYPILQGQTEEAYAARRAGKPYPVAVCWDVIKDHETQAQSNHGGQTLKHLAERGGLSPKELWCVAHDTKFHSEQGMKMTEALAIDWLRGLGELVEWRTW